MINIIKTAIITITISFISGVLLDTYKNLAPRVLFNMRKVKPKKINNIEFKVYKFTVKNISKKIIHNLNLNVKKDNDYIKIEDANISTGLKFDLSEEDNTYNVSIPFLSTNDEFSVRILVKAREGSSNKPIVALRSPENFKKIYSEGKVKRISLLGNENRSNSFFKNKKLVLGAVGILVVIYIGILAAEQMNKATNNINTSNRGNATITTSSSSSANKSEDKSQKDSSTTKDKVSTGNNVTTSSKVNANSQESIENKVSTDNKESTNNLEKTSTVTPTEQEDKIEEKPSDTDLDKTQNVNNDNTKSSEDENNNIENTSLNENSLDLDNNSNNTENNTTDPSATNQATTQNNGSESKNE